MKTLLTIAAGLVSSFLCLVILFGGNDFGESVKRGPVELYYTESVSEDEANKLLDLLFDIYADSDKTLYFQVDSTESGKSVKYVVIPEAWVDSEYDTAFAALELMIESSVFENEDVAIHLCDGEFETKRTLNRIDHTADPTDIADSDSVEDPTEESST